MTNLFVLVVLVLAASAALRFVATAKAVDGDDDVYRLGGLVLVDKAGKTRGMWIVTEDGDATLTLNDGREEPRLVMLVDKQGHTEVSMLGRAGTLRGSWTATTAGESEIALHDGKGTGRVGIKVGQSVSAILLNDSAGQTRTMWSVLGVGAVKKAELGFYDTEAKRRLALMSVSDGTPAVVFPDASNPMASLGGWYVRGKEVVTIPRGDLPATLGR